MSHDPSESELAEMRQLAFYRDASLREARNARSAGHKTLEQYMYRFFRDNAHRLGRMLQQTGTIVVRRRRYQHRI